MTDKIFEEENHIYQIDFSAALWATDQLHTVFQTNTVSLLSDVDFVAETEDEVLLVEYKNANISNASNPGAFRPRDQKLVQKIAFKYYDSWIYLRISRFTTSIFWNTRMEMLCQEDGSVTWQRECCRSGCKISRRYRTI